MYGRNRYVFVFYSFDQIFVRYLCVLSDTCRTLQIYDVTCPIFIVSYRLMSYRVTSYNVSGLLFSILVRHGTCFLSRKLQNMWTRVDLPLVFCTVVPFFTPSSLPPLSSPLLHRPSSLPPPPSSLLPPPSSFSLPASSLLPLP